MQPPIQLTLPYGRLAWSWLFPSGKYFLLIQFSEPADRDLHRKKLRTIFGVGFEKLRFDWRCSTGGGSHPFLVRAY
jgi:hypothetical protein